MTRRESRWITVLIIALVVILRAPTLLPSLCLVPLTDEDYYGTIANDILDGGLVYHTAVDTKPPGIYYIYAGIFRVAGRNNLRAVHILGIIVVAATALVVRRIGARVGDEWAGAWSGIGYAVFIHAYQPGDTLAPNTEIFASLPLALSVLGFLQGEKKASWGWMFLSGALVGAATLIRQPSAVNCGRDAGMPRLRLADSSHSVAGKRCASRQRHRGRIPRPHRGARPVLPIAGEPARRVSMDLGVCHSLRRVRNNTPVCPETSRHGPPRCDTLLGPVVVLWHPPGDLELEIIATHEDRVHSSNAARFVAGRHLSDNLYRVAVFRALLSGIASASVDSRRSGILALYCATPACSSTALGMDTNGRHRGGGRAGDRLSKHGVRAA